MVARIASPYFSGPTYMLDQSLCNCSVHQPLDCGRYQDWVGRHSYRSANSGSCSARFGRVLGMTASARLTPPARRARICSNSVALRTLEEQEVKEVGARHVDEIAFTRAVRAPGF